MEALRPYRESASEEPAPVHREADPDKELRRVTPEDELAFCRKKLDLLAKLEDVDARASDFKERRMSRQEFDEYEILKLRAIVIENLNALRRSVEGTELTQPDYDDPAVLEAIVAASTPEPSLRLVSTPAAEARPEPPSTPERFTEGERVFLGEDPEAWQIKTIPGENAKVAEVARMKNGNYYTKIVNVGELKRSKQEQAAEGVWNKDDQVIFSKDRHPDRGPWKIVTVARDKEDPFKVVMLEIGRATPQHGYVSEYVRPDELEKI